MWNSAGKSLKICDFRFHFNPFYFHWRKLHQQPRWSARSYHPGELRCCTCKRHSEDSACRRNFRPFHSIRVIGKVRTLVKGEHGCCCGRIVCVFYDPGSVVSCFVVHVMKGSSLALYWQHIYLLTLLLLWDVYRNVWNVFLCAVQSVVDWRGVGTGTLSTVMSDKNCWA